ncbi:MAG: hypothetical protein WBF90_01555, partial [Rivularia sp. (in: cyanobacteria)]
ELIHCKVIANNAFKETSLRMLLALSEIIPQYRLRCTLKYYCFNAPYIAGSESIRSVAALL